jgi:hypothetical protein
MLATWLETVSGEEGEDQERSEKLTSTSVLLELAAASAGA